MKAGTPIKVSPLPQDAIDYIDGIRAHEKESRRPGKVIIRTRPMKRARAKAKAER